MGDTRTLEQKREHYEIEKQLAERLRSSTREERRALYASVYDELFARVPHHPQLQRKSAEEMSTRDRVARRLSDLRPLLRADRTFLHVGPGDCALTLEAAKLAKRAYAVDVSSEITKGLVSPPNFELILSDGVSIPVPPGSVDVAYSDYLMEHLHPDDALDQLRNIYAALAPGGVYFCITPNRLNGPHDISVFFDRVATGLHLKEYTLTELAGLFRETGFSRVRAYTRIGRLRVFLPPAPIEWCERLLSALPYPLRRRIASAQPMRFLLGIKLVGTK